MSTGNKYISKNEALLKLQHYCAYQDRCHYEVRSKLLSLKIYGDDLEDIISDLIQENFLDEERYARSYARGKFKIKKWGRMKITQELKRRKVSAYCIKKGLTEIEEEEYLQTAEILLSKYYKGLTGKEPIMRQKTYAHGARKGYESAVIVNILNQLRRGEI